MSADGGDVAIVGAGLIGLSVAWELACRGAQVRVFDRGAPARGASWAGAGMLAPYTEHAGDEDLLALCVASLAQYPEFVERLRAQTAIDVHLELDGILNVAYDARHVLDLQARAAGLHAGGVDCRWYDAAALQLFEPALGAPAGALMVDGEGSVDNRRLGRALVAACLARGVTIAGESGEVAIECDARRARGVRSARGFTPAYAVVNAAGAWAAAVSGVPPAAAPPVEPVKGQMMELAIPDGFVRHTTWMPGAYLVPRDGGRLMIGATVERTGFDDRITARGQHQLLDAVMRGAPALGAFTIADAWSGLRPGTPDGRPFLGPTEVDGLWLAAGHHRNGILLAPITGRLLADAIEGCGNAAIAPFLLERMRTEPAAAARITRS